MRLIAYTIIVLSILACEHVHSDNLGLTSKWLTLKDSFAKKDLTEFKLDNNLDYESFHKISNRLLDSSKSDQWNKIYLYSWQQRDSSFTEFTTIIKEEDRGVRIMYYVFDKKDSLISATPVAWINVEQYKFDTWSRFKSKNILVSTRTMTLPTKSEKTIADTSIVEIVFNKNGSVSEKKIYEKKELKLDD